MPPMTLGWPRAWHSVDVTGHSTKVTTRRWVAVGVGLGATALLAIAVVLLLGRYSLQALGATEGDAPTEAQMGFPATAVVTSTGKECGSGGCWTVFDVEPADGVTQARLRAELDAQLGDRLPGTFLDPRSINVYTEDSGNGFEVRGDFWSRAAAP